MKKILLVLLALAFASLGYGATVGNGTCTIGSAEVLTGQRTSLVFTYTVKTNNMVNGNVWVKLPTVYGFPDKNRMTLSGNGTQAKQIKTWSDGGYYYVGVTATANIDQTIILTWNNITITATAGERTFTWASADSTKNTYTAVAIASLPVQYAWESKNPIAWGTILPTPVVERSDRNKLAYEVAWTVSPVEGGSIYWQMAKGTAGINSTPNPVTFVVNGTDKENAVVFLATPNHYSTPVCNATECYVQVMPNQTISIGEKVRIEVGKPTGTPTQVAGGWHGTNYSKGMGLLIKANACAVAQTQTPMAYPTYHASGFLLLTATPTVAMSLVKIDGKNYTYTISKPDGRAYADIYDGSSIWGKSPAGQKNFVFNASVGYHNITGVVQFYDDGNDGQLRSNTTTTFSFSTLGNWTADSIAQLNNAGFIAKEFASASIGASVQRVTRFAEDRLLLYVDVDGAGACQYKVDVGGTSMNGGTTTAIGSHPASGYIRMSPFGSVAYVVAESWVKVSGTVGTAGAKDILWGTVKVSDWKTIEK